MDILEVISKNIRKYRTLKGFSQETLANKSNIDRTYIADIENSKRNVSIKILEKIAIALEIEIKELLNK